MYRPRLTETILITRIWYYWKATVNVTYRRYVALCVYCVVKLTDHYLSNRIFICEIGVSFSLRNNGHPTNNILCVIATPFVLNM